MLLMELKKFEVSKERNIIRKHHPFSLNNEKLRQKEKR